MGGFSRRDFVRGGFSAAVCASAGCAGVAFADEQATPAPVTAQVPTARGSAS